ncbi:hypothetical protein C8234_02900, partial [Paracidovorax avenae]
MAWKAQSMRTVRSPDATSPSLAMVRLGWVPFHCRRNPHPGSSAAESGPGRRRISVCASANGSHCTYCSHSRDADFVPRKGPPIFSSCLRTPARKRGSGRALSGLIRLARK